MQEDIIRAVLDGRDTLALLPTGGGKSLCFQVPALAMGRLCLVVSPLIALMKDQVARLRKQGIAARAIISGMSYAEIENALESAALGKLSFLYVSPERLGSELFLARLPRLPLGLIAVDEAHCISQWGYDFRPAYLRVQELREKVPGVPVLALTASATPTVAQDIMDRLAFREPNLLRGAFARPELVLWVSQGEDKHGRLLRIMEHVPGTSIIYMRERRGTVRTAAFLAQHGIAAAAYHAGLPAEERDRIQQAWTTGSIRTVVATNAFGMGIDKADVRCVVHLEPPPDLESYYQEAGRGGRDGKKAHAFLLHAQGDELRLRDRLAASFPELADVRRTYQALADMHRIALGSGLLETYEIDIRALADRTGLKPITVAHALKALELDGRLVLSEGVRTPSRVLFTAAPSVIYHMRVNDRRMAPLLEALLRLYGGLFEEPSIIDEVKLGRLTEWNVDKVMDRLREMDRQRVLSYRPRSDKPSATLLTPRADAQRLQLDPAALKDRQQRAADRLEAMLTFVKTRDRCRSAILLEHFGEPGAMDCGQCDVCRSMQLRYADSPDTTIISEPLAVYDRPLDAHRWELDEYGGVVRKEEGT
jgi:ATP-dependent DNA helicase RecQ